jgi:NhaP-type Na+/H+ or K+/H+ antiporter
MVSMDDFIIIFLFGVLFGLVLGGAIGIIQVSLKNNHKKSDNDNIMQDE